MQLTYSESHPHSWQSFEDLHINFEASMSKRKKDTGYLNINIKKNILKNISRVLNKTFF